MLNVLILRPLIPGPTGKPLGPRPSLSTTSPFQAVAFWAS